MRSHWSVNRCVFCLRCFVVACVLSVFLFGLHFCECAPFSFIVFVIIVFACFPRSYPSVRASCVIRGSSKCVCDLLRFECPLHFHCSSVRLRNMWVWDCARMRCAGAWVCSNHSTMCVWPRFVLRSNVCSWVPVLCFCYTVGPEHVFFAYGVDDVFLFVACSFISEFYCVGMKCLANVLCPTSSCWGFVTVFE